MVKDFVQLLHETPLKELFKFRELAGPLISVDLDTNLRQVLKIFVDTHVLSVPVLKGDRVVAIFDHIDLLNLVIENLESFDAAKTLAENLETMKLEQVLDLSRNDPLLVADKNSPLFSVTRFFSSGLSHRAVVHHDAGYTIVSQTDVMNFLVDAMDQDAVLRDLAQQPLMSLLHNRSTTWNTEAVNQDTPLEDVLKKLKELRLSSVALVDSDGALTGNFSASDIRLLYGAGLKEFKLTVQQVLQKYSPASLKPMSVDKQANPSVGKVLRLLSENSLHRLWIVDTEHMSRGPVGVVTQTDMIHLVSAMTPEDR